jgi:ABC-type antimicrobial peptide transport system permease subunit
MGMIIAVTGVYALVAHSVQQRVREIGLRMALGASFRDVLRLVMREGAIVAAIGIAMGLPIALVARRLIASWLYEVAANDPLVVMPVAALLLAATLAATYVPARRAARINPMTALRTE